ncbi:SusC/RagA family TonB-linked outer membrane protein [Adhaeribacter aerolatus]|uniref:SusC/RagA family TonB-linked outer membrane protein n=1 Tax=Adhaeribacter aerolatus TaxID=670289 RepID=A0A512AUH5_9BACT|nr:SusC/RagA family TonB-linked outer membrane protein [Adhaeribacter aerolatus]
MQVQAKAFSQKISISEQNAPLEKVFKEIRRQSGYLFLYNTELLRKAKPVTVSVKEASLERVLDACFHGQPLTYSLMEKTIVVKPKEEVKEETSIRTPLDTEIRGKVQDENGGPLPGVSINVKGTATGTITDAGGNYSLSVPESKTILVFSFIGYVSKEININGRTTVDIRMEPDTKALEEVVVVGYGTQKKSDLTGAVGSVKASQLTERPSVNLEQALAGRIAGVNVSTNSGRPGGRTAIAIRGYSSVNAANDPLYVVDGIIWTGGINTINPNDIESIDVLKDASSTAIYGTRGTNGVIIVTTKRGKKGAKLVGYDNYVSLGYLPNDRKYDVMNSKEFLFIEEEQYRNAPKFDPAGFAAGKYPNPVTKRKNYLVDNTLGNRELFTLDENGVPQPIYDVDWQDITTRKAISQSHNLSFTGGDDKTNYGLFLGYADEQGIVKESFQKRYNVRAVVDQQMKNWLKVGMNLSYANNRERRVDENVGSNNSLRQLVEMVTFIPYKHADGTYGYRGDYAGLEKGDNPLAQIYENNLLYNSNVFNGNTYANFKIIKDLEFTSTLGVNIGNNINPYFKTTKSDLQGGLGKNYSRITSSESKFWQWSNRINYNKVINEDHAISMLLGTELQKSNSLNWAAITSVMPDDYYSYNNLGAGATPLAPNSSTNAFQMQSYFGRLNYNFKERYLFTVTGRSDGSSRFGANNKFAFFPSAAAAWRISNEDFLMKSSAISNLKLRGSYGLTGNSEIGSYKSQANLSTNSYIFGGIRASGSAIGRLANPELQWEKTAQFDVGIDLGLLDNRISVEADYFVKKTHDLLYDAPVPATSGYTIVTRNIGSMENRGFEFSLNTVNVRNSVFSWSTNFNISTLKNKITALGVNNEDILYGTKEGLILRVGESAGSFYGYLRDGIWGTAEADKAATYGQKPGDLRIKDINNDGVITGLDRVILGKGIPDLYGTFANSLRYKNFDFILEIQFSQGNDVFNQARNSGEARQGLANSFATVLDAWTPENQDAELEQVRPTAAGYNYYMDSRKVSDGSFIRGKNVVLGYTLPQSITSKIGLNNLRIYASGQNFFLKTKYFGYDPEVTTYEEFSFSQGFTYYEYPKPRTFMAGLNVNF